MYYLWNLQVQLLVLLIPLVLYPAAVQYIVFKHFM